MMSPHLYAPLRSPSASLASLLSPQLEAINACILENIHSTVSLIPQIAGHLIALGGKRLRPLLTVAAAELCGYEGDRSISLAASIEFIHTATLLHDDVVDESILRRGQISANAKWSNQASVLVGDFLFSRAFELVVADGSSEILQILSEASSRIVEGEVMQLVASHDLNLTSDTYLTIIEHKTASLFEAAVKIGAVVGEADAAQKDALAGFGKALGMAFQLTDDCLDYTANQDVLGKTIGDDFRERKVTLPVIFAYVQGVDRPFWDRVFGEGNQKEEDFAHGLHLLKNSGALHKTRQLAQDYAHEALNHLSYFPESLLQIALQELTLSSLGRET